MFFNCNQCSVKNSCVFARYPSYKNTVWILEYTCTVVYLLRGNGVCAPPPLSPSHQKRIKIKQKRKKEGEREHKKKLAPAPIPSSNFICRIRPMPHPTPAMSGPTHRYVHVKYKHVLMRVGLRYIHVLVGLVLYAESQQGVKYIYKDMS